MKKVVKFSGSSLASAKQFEKMADIIKADKSRRYVVPSAPGKHSDEDERVTDTLYTCYDAVMEDGSYKKILKKIKSRYLDIIDGLGLNLNLDHEFEKIEENFLAKAGRDYAASRGEYLNGTITANYLGYEFIDAAEVIFFDGNGNFEADLTDRKLSKRLEHVERAVIPGFYDSKHDGTVETFSRGDSDVANSIVAKAIHTDMYEDWADVSGVLVTDPRVVDDPEVIRTITYERLRELSYMGASVLHKDTVFPIHKKGILINIRSINRPEDKGTLIVESTCHRPRRTITRIAGRRGFCSINIKRAMMNTEVGSDRKMSSIFGQYGTSSKHIPSSIDTMAVYVRQSGFEEHERSVIAGVHRAVEPDTVELESDLALIIAVGRGMRSNRGTAGKAFSALAHAKVSVKMIDQGSNEWNIIIRVENDDFETAICTIYGISVVTEL